MKVKEWEKQHTRTRIGLEMGNNPHGQAIGQHLEREHGLNPNGDIYAGQMNDHRAALMAGDIKLAELAGGTATTPEPAAR